MFFKRGSFKKSHDILGRRRSRVDFLAHIGHEIRNPLYGIVGTASLLGKTTLTEEQKFYITTLENSSKALMGMVDDVLDFSKFSRGILEINRVYFCLKSLCAEVVQLCSTAAAAKGLTVSYEIDDGIWDRGFYGDCNRIRQVLINFLTNGIKYTKSGSIHVHWKLDRSYEKHQSIRCEVTDTGIGISPELQPLVFQPFFRADHSIMAPGAGLGLSICKMIVDKLDGDIGFISAPQVGSTFWFKIKMLKASSSSTSETQPPVDFADDVDMCAFRVLVAEDNEVNQAILARMLNKMGLACRIVSNGNEVLRALADERYDLILMDCYMSPLDGFETAKQIRLLREDYRNIPIVAFTAAGATEDRKRCEAAGMNDVLLKPATYDQLLEKLDVWGRRVIEGTPSLDECALEKIRSFNTPNQDLLVVLFEMFKKNTQEDFSTMEGMIREQNFEGLRRKAHKIKSSAAQLGAMRLRRCCQAMESDLSGDADKAIRLLRSMMREHEEALKQFADYCQRYDQKSDVLH